MRLSRQMTWYQMWAWMGNDADKVQLREFINGCLMDDCQRFRARMDVLNNQQVYKEGFDGWWNAR